jgi:hypothetical protein
MMSFMINAVVVLMYTTVRVNMNTTIQNKESCGLVLFFSLDLGSSKLISSSVQTTGQSLEGKGHTRAEV